MTDACSAALRHCASKQIRDEAAYNVQLGSSTCTRAMSRWEGQARPALAEGPEQRRDVHSARGCASRAMHDPTRRRRSSDLRSVAPHDHAGGNNYDRDLCRRSHRTRVGAAFEG